MKLRSRGTSSSTYIQAMVPHCKMWKAKNGDEPTRPVEPSQPTSLTNTEDRSDRPVQPVRSVDPAVEQKTESITPASAPHDEELTLAPRNKMMRS